MIQIYNDYYLAADSMQFILLKKTYTKPTFLNNYQGGTIKFEKIGYYKYLYSVYESIVRDCERNALQDENVSSFRDFLAMMSGIIGTLEGTVKELERVKKSQLQLKVDDLSEDEDDDGETPEESL